MTPDDFDFELPPGQIAQRPAAARDGARLMVLAGPAAPAHDRIDRLPDRLLPGDLLVLNDTRVLPARLYGTKPSGGRVELLLIRPSGDGPRWTAWLKSGRKPAPGTRLDLGAGHAAVVVEREGREWTVELSSPAEGVMADVGAMPLPPYVQRTADDDDELRRLDRERYQTVFAERPGAIAAPTAGLHFTPRLLERLADRGVETARVTLHVGIGTFEPVAVDRVEDHRLHPERVEVGEDAVAAVERTRERGGRVVAVGTTVTRALESAAAPGRLRPFRGEADLFIRPGYNFRVIDALLTNFHLPRSTLLMLVSALVGRERTLDAYRLAVSEGYRFFSYGDAMLCLPERP